MELSTGGLTLATYIYSLSAVWVIVDQICVRKSALTCFNELSKNWTGEIEWSSRKISIDMSSFPNQIQTVTS